MKLIMGLIRPKQPELFALDLRKLLYFTLFTLYKYQPISTKLGQNIYDRKISGELLGWFCVRHQQFL